MEYDARGPLLKVLLLISGKSSRMGARKAFLRLPDGRPVFEHALETLHSAVPSASTIYISFQDETRVKDFEAPLREFIARNRAAEDADQNEHDDQHPAFPILELIFDEKDEDIGPAAGLLAAHSLHPDAKWLVLSLPETTEYQSLITCFVNESGLAQPLIAIWDSEALEKLEESVKGGSYELKDVVKEVKGRLIKPLREEWIVLASSRE